MRNPRKRAYTLSYAAHVAQGMIVAILLPPPVMALVLALYYLRYQEVESVRFQQVQSRRDANLSVVDDWPSRDIADWMIGGWVGLPISTVAWASALCYYL